MTHVGLWRTLTNGEQGTLQHLYVLTGPSRLGTSCYMIIWLSFFAPLIEGDFVCNWRIAEFKSIVFTH